MQNSFQFNLTPSATSQSLPTAARRSSKGNKKEKLILLGMSMASPERDIDGGKREEHCNTGAGIAVAYSSTNPKFCADPMVARKQLTVKWGDQRD